MRNVLALCSLVTTIACCAQVERWMTLFDGSGTGSTDVQGSVAIYPDTTYRAMAIWNESGIGHLRARAIARNGDTLWTKAYVDTTGSLTTGSSHITERLPNGTWLWAGGLYPGGGDPDAIVYCFSANGDTLWRKRFITPTFNAFNALCITPDGGACLAGVSNAGNSQFYVARITSNGDSLWARSHGTNLAENAVSIGLTADSGFVVAGYKVQTGNQYDMHVMRLNAEGDLLWQRSYGSPWDDNWGFVAELSDGRLVLASAERISANALPRPVLYLLESDGDEIWSKVLDDGPAISTFLAIPIPMPDGHFVVSGSERVNGVPNGMLVRTDSTGNLIWRRLYATNTQIDSYIYDVRRTVDGGFILAGTAFDSGLVSQDAWLVKVDSFGCLVPGCQVFDGLEEQVTDLRDALEVFPNPASEQATVRITLPEGTKSKNLRLALVSAEGKLVHEEAVASMAPTHVLDVTRCAPGLYFVHLLDGTRWLSGTKVVVE